MTDDPTQTGEVAEWLKASVSKTDVLFEYPGFESLPLRQKCQPNRNFVIDNRLELPILLLKVAVTKQ